MRLDCPNVLDKWISQGDLAWLVIWTRFNRGGRFWGGLTPRDAWLPIPAVGQLQSRGEGFSKHRIVNVQRLMLSEQR